MILASGSRLGPYEIIEPVGAGGMGEVYRASDTRLGREVAIKVLPPDVAQDAERIARFQREARLLAALNHPNIAQVYGFESAVLADGSAAHFLAMELVPGEDLAERTRTGPIPVDEAFEIARQVAEALEEAHEKGIVHRDLKPANIKLTPDGKVKVLDFGLAKAYVGESAARSSTDPSQSPTLTSAGTRAGIILGTAAYMSPEQARGKPVDKRTDIWAFGAVLFEMLTGRPAFEGETVTDILATVLSGEPEWSALPKSVGPATRRLLARCLDKNARRRYRDIGDVAFDLAAAPAADAEPSASPSGPGRRAARMAWATAGVFAAAALVLGGLYWRHLTIRPPVPRFEKLTFAPQFITNARFTADGRTVVYSAAREGNTSEMFVRHPEDLQPQPIGGADVQLLSVSSKGELAILTRARYRSHRTYIGTLARMPLAEASPREIRNDVTAAEWSPDGTELAVIHQVEGRSRLEYPIGSVLAETTGYLSDIRISRKGDRIAYMSHAYEGDDRGRVTVVDRARTVLAQSPEYWGVGGLAWSADSATVFFSASDQGSTYTVRELSMDGSVRTVLADPAGLSIHDTTQDGRLLVSTYVDRGAVVARFAGAPAERDVPWRELSFAPVLARDGRGLLFTDQSELAGPNYSVYFLAADSPSPVRLGEGCGVDFSPDGSSVLVIVPVDPPRLVIYATGAGEPRDISVAGFASYDYDSTRFSGDGRAVVFCGSQTGKASRCYVRDLAGASVRAVTPEGTDHGHVSPDGSAIVARAGDGRYQIYHPDGRIPTSAPGLDNRDEIIAWRTDGRSLRVYRPMEIPTQVVRLDLSTGQRTLLRELAPADRAGALRFHWVSFSSDESAYAYCMDRAVGGLYVVAGAGGAP